MVPQISEHRSEIADLCRRLQVRKLEVFGSAEREADFDPFRSDIDFLVEFTPSDAPPPLSTYFALRDGLSATVGRPVDLVMMESIRNPYLRASIERSKETVYAA